MTDQEPKRYKPTIRRGYPGEDQPAVSNDTKNAIGCGAGLLLLLGVYFVFGEVQPLGVFGNFSLPFFRVAGVVMIVVLGGVFWYFLGGAYDKAQEEKRLRDDEQVGL